MFLEKDIYVIKWRAQFFAAGYVRVKWCNRWATLHISQLLDQREREFFAFGTIKYHDRYQWVAKVTVYDKHGNLLGSPPQTLLPNAPPPRLSTSDLVVPSINRGNKPSVGKKRWWNQSSRKERRDKLYSSPARVLPTSNTHRRKQDRRGPVIKELNVS
ncbi:PREDICTED: uncharacterized protein LOC106804765 [Priapulus caudatus]|uniref:Uncharacterized protein LOC106804765 n=1 Tax=Priapulus caudatus TaxID=37621 RepID=A0ABM1DNQ6_PRICU|nr:PREDICTED: uncharacterized protein LOC106804765 [Priapulus caudatus]